MKSINILWQSTGSDDEFSFRARATIEQLVDAWLDFAFGYDMIDDALESINNWLDSMDIDFEILEYND